MPKTIRDVFSPRRPIDRTIEKVVDYYAQEESRLAQEVSEYEITDNIESCFRKFLDAFGEGVRLGRVTEVGIWVSGFYGSGKSSFTKYLGTALDPEKKVGDRPFLELLCERFNKKEIPAALRTVAKNHAATVVFLDLGAEQLAESAATPVTTVLYWKVLQWAGYSKEKKIARLEFKLDRMKKYEEFKILYKEKYKEDWEAIHNDPLIGVARASEIAPALMPTDFPTPESFRSLRFEEAQSVRDLAAEIIELCKRKTGRENILFLIDEAGQYVAPRGELILNLDGFSRNLKELGKGKVWVVATGQQTLTEIIERAAHNSAELNKLRDRFPISIHLDATDIREITYRRLLEKSDTGWDRLQALFKDHGQAMVTHTRLTGTALFKGDPDADTFTRLYPFLPQHFDLLLELIRTLARSTGGIGLRSAIRVIQDVLVDKSRVLPGGTMKLADRQAGVLSCVDDFYDTLRADIARALPHVMLGVDKTIKIFGADSVECRVAKAVGALQPVETFPRTAENIAALLYRMIDTPSLLDQVREALRRLTAEKECGLIEDPQAGGYVFLSDAVRPIREKRNGYIPSSGDCMRKKVEILKQGTAENPLFRTQPTARLENNKDVKAAVKIGRAAVVGTTEDVSLSLEFVDPALWEEKREEMLVKTNTQAELLNTVVLLAKNDGTVEDLLPEISRSDKVVGDIDERGADRDVAQFLRAERRLAEKNRDRVGAAISKAMLEGVFIFRGKPMPVKEAGVTLDSAVKNALSSAVKEIFPYYHLAVLRPATDAASKFLNVERLDRMPKELDPLGLVQKAGGSVRVDATVKVLAETLRLFKIKSAEAGGGRLSGSAVQDLFSSPPYGWTKDTVRYLLAALLRAGEIELHIPGEGRAIQAAGPQAAEAFKSTNAFNRVGIAVRDAKIDVAVLDRAAKCLEKLFGDEVLPLEDNISRAVRRRLPGLVEKLGALPEKLRLLSLAGVERAQSLLAEAADLLKGDDGGAAAVLGGVECTLPGEVAWAKAVEEALSSGAEDDIRKARSLMASMNEIETLFPGDFDGLISPEQKACIIGVLDSERFFEQLPELRGTVSNIIENVRVKYAKERAGLSAVSKERLVTLEADPDWLQLLDEDRAEIAEQLKCDLPEKAIGDDPVLLLRKLLVKRDTLPKLMGDLRKEIQRRIPPEPEPQEPEGEEVIGAGALIQPAVITSVKDLDTWLDEIRKKLGAILKKNKKIRIRTGE
jgi:hypothetical protein